MTGICFMELEVLKNLSKINILLQDILKCKLWIASMERRQRKRKYKTSIDPWKSMIGCAVRIGYIEIMTNQINRLAVETSEIINASLEPVCTKYINGDTYVPVCLGEGIRYAKIKDKQQAIDELLEKRLLASDHDKKGIDYTLTQLLEDGVEVFENTKTLSAFEIYKLKQ